MDMRLNRFLLTDQNLLSRKFFQFTDQNLLRIFRLLAGQHLLTPGFFQVTGQRFHGGFFRQVTHQMPDLLTAGFRVGMGLAFRFLTGIHPFIAAIPVGMATGQTVTVRTMGVTAFQGVAPFVVGMPRRCVAAFVMGMSAFGDIAPICVEMAFRFRYGTDQLRHHGLGIAVVPMAMGLDAAEGLPLLGNGRQDQGVGGAEHHETAQHADDLLPSLSKPLLFLI